MNKTLDVLIVDDSKADALLLVRHLKSFGYDVRYEHADGREAMAAALHARSFDVVLCDYSMPGFDGRQAFGVLLESKRDLPFIIVSGAVGEETAVECMRLGVHDFVLKDHLARLAPAIEREMGEAKMRADLRASEETLQRTEKLRALGQMAAGISHDLKNLLNPLSLHLQVIARALDKGKIDQAKESVVEMKQVVARGVEVVERLRDYSRQAPESRPEQVDLNRLAHEALELARPRAAARRVAVRFLEELGQPPLVHGRPSEIVAALVNLVVNAVDVLEASGTVTVVTGAAENGAFVAVTDDGPGMPPEVEARVFEPFFTTKGAEGTGLGLAMVYACMQRHGGDVELTTTRGRGTTFTLRFPSGEPPALRRNT